MGNANLIPLSEARELAFDNLRIDNKSNKEIEEIISNFNSSNKRFLNKITFKNFVNDILIAYFG